MPWLGPSTEYQIGRGEVAETRVEVPFFVGFTILCALILAAVHLYVDRPDITLALAVTMLVFGITVLRVSFGVGVLIVAMMLSPEISAGHIGTKHRELNLRYDDILIITIFMGVLLRITWERRSLLWRPSPINPAIAIYLVVALLSTGIAFYRNVPYFDETTAIFVLIKMVEFYMVFVLVGNAISNTRQIRGLLTLFFIVALGIAAYGAFTVGTVSRVSAPMERGGSEPNTLGGYFMLVMVLALALYTQAPSLRKRLLFLVIFAAVFWPFLHTLSRASYLALAAGMLAVAYAGRSWLVAGVVVVGLIISPLIMPEDVVNRVNYTFQRGHGEPISIAGKPTGLQVDKSTYERIYVWRKVGFNLKVWPLFGGGISWDTVMDSQYARVLIETGLLGFAAFLFLQFRILKTTRQAYMWSRDWVSRAVSIAAFAGTLGLIVHSFGTISFLIVRIMEPYWVFVALAVVVRLIAIQEYQQRKLKQTEAAPAPSPPPRQRTLPAPAAASMEFK